MTDTDSAKAQPTERVTTEALMHRLLTGREFLVPEQADRLIADLVAKTRRGDADLIEHWHGQAPDVYSPQDSAALLRHVADGGDPKSTGYPATGPAS